MNCRLPRRFIVPKILRPITETITLYPSGYDSANSKYRTVSSSHPLSNAVGKGSDNTTYAQWDIAYSNYGTCYVFYTFNTSQIPENAIIDSVTCKAKGYISPATSSYVTTRQMQMYSGTSTQIGTSLDLTSTATEQTFSAVSNWTRDMLNDFRIRCYARRGTNNTTSAVYVRFYGATLEITYTYMG